MYIKQKNHLPGLESADYMKNKGIGVGEMQTKLLQKLEELTLYIIELNNKNDAQMNEIELLNKQLKEMKNITE